MRIPGPERLFCWTLKTDMKLITRVIRIAQSTSTWRMRNSMLSITAYPVASNLFCCHRHVWGHWVFWDVKRGASTPLKLSVSCSQVTRGPKQGRYAQNDYIQSEGFAIFTYLASHAESSYYIHMVASFRTKITHGGTFRGQLGRAWIRSATEDKPCNLLYNSTGEYSLDVSWLPTSRWCDHICATSVDHAADLPPCTWPFKCLRRNRLWLWDLVLKCWWSEVFCVA